MNTQFNTQQDNFDGMATPAADFGAAMRRVMVACAIAFVVSFFAH